MHRVVPCKLRERWKTSVTGFWVSTGFRKTAQPNMVPPLTNAIYLQSVSMRISPMTERSLFNVACKLLGLWLLFRAASSFFWAFLASRYSEQFLLEPPEAFGWYLGTVSLLFGAFLCCRSGWITQRLFAIDVPLDCEPANAMPRKLMPFSSSDDEDQSHSKSD